MLAEAHESDARAARETKDFLSTINAASGDAFSQRENTGTTAAAATKERFSVTAWKARENSFRERHDMGPLRHLTHEKRQRQRLQKWLTRNRRRSCRRWKGPRGNSTKKTATF